MARGLYITFLCLIVAIPAHGDHLMGGEITWKCQANGSFKFTLKLYRDCKGVSLDSLTFELETTHPIGAIPLTLVSKTDISPVGPGCIPCDSNVTGLLWGRTEEFIFSSADIFLNGIPPPQGWIFYYGSCCRNASISNLVQPANQGFTLRAIMYSYNNTNTNPCFDSSPYFIERPSVNICTRNSFKYNHNSVDTELDSLYYEWAEALNSSTTWPPPTLMYVPPYAFNNPLPDNTLHPNNIPALMDPQSGEVSFTSFTQGGFVVVTKVSAYKCGIKVAEIFREIQIRLQDCIIDPGPPAVFNTDPDVTAPFPDATGLFTKFDTTVCVGDTVSFSLIVTDNELLPNGTNQTVTLTASSVQFGNNYTDPNAGCLNPPCATLSPVPPVISQTGSTVNFNWVTDCNHLAKNVGCTDISNLYSFVFRSQDDFCPSPAVNFTTVTIRVKTDSVPPPSLRCIQVNTDGSALITWVPVLNLNTCELRSFHSYDIYYSYNINGPYLFLDSVIGNPNATSYLHLNANANNQSIYYFVSTRWGCDKFSLNPNISASDTLQSIYLNVDDSNPVLAVLNWNAIHVPNVATSTGWYKIFKRKGTFGNWVLLDSTQTIGINYSDSAWVCNDSVFYRIEIADQSGCLSVSNVAGGVFQSNSIQLNRPTLHCTAVDSNGDVTITWNLPLDTAHYFDNYEIWHSTSISGPYSLLQSINNYSTNNYTHVGANANTQVNYYFIKINAGCTPNTLVASPASDTLATMLLTATPITGFALLSWNEIHNPLLTTTQLPYEIYRNDGGGWILIGLSSTNSYTDTIINCDVTYSYKIHVPDQTGCVSISSESQNIFSYEPPPIDPPSLRCIAVNADGSVTLNWISPADPDGLFKKFEIYHRTGSAFMLVDSVLSINTTTYNHLSATGNTQINSYFMVTYYGCMNNEFMNSLTSDTLSSMLLDVNNSNPEIALLTWTPIHVPVLSTSSANYHIYKKGGSTGSWVLIDSVATLNYEDTAQICSDSVFYRIEMGDQSGCVSVSNESGNLFTDITPPSTPVIDSVSVDITSGNVFISWDVNIADDTQGYIIYQFNGSSYDSIGSVIGIINISFINTNSDANNLSETYAVAAFDNCGNISPLSLPHNTIFAEALLYDICTRSISVNWNEYININSGLNNYEILYSIDGISYTSLATINPGSLNIIHSEVNSGTEYCYIIIAENNDGTITSTSNVSCVIFPTIVEPQFCYITSVTVAQSGHVLLKCFVDTLADVNGYRIERANAGSGVYNTIDFITPNISNQIFTYEDVTAKTQDLSYSYRVIVVDSCGEDKMMSNIAKTIHVQGEPDDYFHNHINWNDYEWWAGGIDSYNIYRRIKNFQGVTQIATVPFGIKSYTDAVSGYYDTQGEFCYLIEAIQGNDTLYSFSDSSNSNWICIKQPIKFYTPNAFTPGGRNPIFKPVQIFTSTENYSFKIFNRWGEIIFSTTNPDEGWDGNIGDKPAPQGVYVYTVKLFDLNGKEFNRKGTFTLLR